MLGALNNLVADYASGVVNTSQAAQDTQALTAALNYVSQQRVTLDNSMTQLTAASGAVTTEKTQLTAAQTNLMQADLPQWRLSSRFRRRKRRRSSRDFATRVGQPVRQTAVMG